ncbi:MAG: efflux RND transporter permease subunit [Alphaproteobacteria bacterium]|nr:efflux RND transporter permease subunit [Alphaproteobacteria bacterium]
MGARATGLAAVGVAFTLACGGAVPGPRVHVGVAWPGAGPAEVEELVLEPLEAAVRGLPDLAEMRSTAREGGVDLSLAMAEGVDPFEAQRAVVDALAGAMLPADAEAPRVALVSAAEPLVLVVEQERAEPVRDALLRIPGVAGVDLAGHAQARPVVLLDPERLGARGLTVSAALAAGVSGRPEDPLVYGEGVDPGDWVVQPGIRLADLATVRVERSPVVRVERGAEPVALVRATLRDRDAGAVLAELGEPAGRLVPGHVVELEGPVGDALLLAGRRFAAALPGAPVVEIDGGTARVWSTEGPVPAGVVDAIALPGVQVHRRTGASAEFVLAGPDGARLEEAEVERIARALAALPGVVDVRPPASTRPELRIEVNRETAARFGVAPSEVALVYRLLAGVEQRGVTFRWAEARDPLDLPVAGPDGTIPLAALASLSTVRAEPVVDHLDGRRVQVLGIDTEPGATVPIEALEIPAGWTIVVR